MPLYQCHKKVRALEIKSIILMTTGDYRLEFRDGRYEPMLVNELWIGKHDVLPDGYYVIYEDGYTSFSPAKAFEEGYTLIADEAPF